MILLVCVDNKNGLTFNHRRVSSDIAVIRRIADKADGGKIYMSSYSAPLFADISVNTVVCDDYLTAAGPEDYCFAEDGDISAALPRCSQIILYCWNRNYPSDVKFPKSSAIADRQLISTVDFEGNSHEKITEEIYR